MNRVANTVTDKTGMNFPAVFAGNFAASPVCHRVAERLAHAVIRGGSRQRIIRVSGVVIGDG